MWLPGLITLAPSGCLEGTHTFPSLPRVALCSRIFGSLTQQTTRGPGWVVALQLTPYRSTERKELPLLPIFRAPDPVPAGWTDSSGNLWLLGGFIASNPFLTAFRNDLWKYSPTTNQWTWVGGSTSTNVPGVYGTQGVGSSSNTPGARSGASSWTDNSGNLWLFGGGGFDSAATNDALNDLWKYNAASNSWTWVGGNDKARAPGVYGTQGTPSANNVPGGRGSSITWVDSDGNVWLFGGFGVDSTGYIGGLNDIWRYSRDCSVSETTR